MKILENCIRLAIFKLNNWLISVEMAIKHRSERWQHTERSVRKKDLRYQAIYSVVAHFKLQ